MTRPARILAALAFASAAWGAVSWAGDDPPPAPPPPAEPPAPPPGDAARPAEEIDPAEEAKARDVVRRAAARQNAADLARPGAIRSFRVVFRKAVFESERTAKDGTRTRALVETDENGLEVDWLAPGSIRTRMVLDGRATTKAWFEPLKGGWIWDGVSEPQRLGGAQYADDLDELMRHRKIVDRLLDVAFLEKMLGDGSRWRLAASAAPYDDADTVAVRRVPPPDAPQAVALSLWFAKSEGGEVGDLRAAAMPPIEEGEPALHYALTYHDAAPKVTLAPDEPGAEPAPCAARFPYGVAVSERRGEGGELRKVLEVFTLTLAVNVVTKDDFRQPGRR